MYTSIISEGIKNPYSYDEYKELIFLLAENQSCTGMETEERINATLINSQRIKRIDKQCILKDELQSEILKIKKRWKWLVIIESWCGDGAQNIGVIAKMAALTPNIELKLILRDENLHIMNLYLTNGSMSVPKLICFNKDKKEEIGYWGPRPKEIQKKVSGYKIEHPYATHEDFVSNLHLWYARDKTEAMQTEFINIIKHWNTN